MTNREGDKDYGQQWYALYRSSLQGDLQPKKVNPKARAKSLKDELAQRIATIASVTGKS